MMALKFMPIAKICVNHLQGRSSVLKSNANWAAFVRRGILYAPPKKNNPAPVATALKNFQIQCPVMRVVYKDKDTGVSTHKILNRDKALELALLYELDLVLVNDSTDPPIARLEDFGKMMQQKTVKLKEIKQNQKARALKEMFVGGGIDKHDLGIKMKKVIEFLSEGHPVRVFVTVKKYRIKTDPFCVEETTLKILELVEDYVASVQQPENFSNLRKDFTLNPKPKVEPKVEPNVPKPASASASASANVTKAPATKIPNVISSVEQEQPH